MSTDKYQVLPVLSDDDYARLRESIRERGVLVPVEVDEDGNILDGYHRDRIASELGIGYKTVVRSGLAEHEKRIHAAMLNLARRQLTEAQRVLVGRTIEPDIAERARLNSLAGTSGAIAPVGRTRDEVARLVGLGSGDTYQRGKKDLERVESLAPQLMPALESGAATLREVNRDMRDLARESEKDAVDHWAKVAPIPTDAKYRSHLADVMAEAGRIAEFDPVEAAGLADEFLALALPTVPKVWVEWVAKFNAARSGVRVLEGGG